ncbi:hypothetical protein BRADI_4g24336v3 [Brachypodium distachyon]|uniref:DUF4220 domain-containing protein n=1 Tax=Brachypodium distachyon TaxID=15368 RepID=A0A0Q3HLZ7_BRADI|nr:hypothetical protein BRADI_4g24336v3 [Brachypodium distachyon]
MASEFLSSIPETVRSLFQHDPSTRAASVQFWVVSSVVVLLLKFAVGAIGPRFTVSSQNVKLGVQIIMILSHYFVSYSLGLMQPFSAERGSVTNDLFQPRQLSTLDLLNSLWSTNQLRARTARYLKAPLWIIWTIHALRVIWFYFSNKASGACVDNMKLVSNYMASRQQKDDTSAITEAETTFMAWYDYLVLGEEWQVKMIQRPRFMFHLDKTHKEDLITVARVWKCSDDAQDKLLGRGADRDSRFKDMCLSFALYKLLRHRFFDFPIPEANHPASRKLVEPSLFQDLSYSKHPVVFADGFPTLRLMLSLLMTGAASYLAYAVRGLPTATIAVTKGGYLARITHGGSVTRFIILIMVCRELWEMGVYVLSQWTKVVIICHYIRLPQSPTGWTPMLHRFVMEKVARIMFCLVRRGRWHQNIRQHNLLMAARAKTTRNRRLRSRSVKLGINVQRVIFESLNQVVSEASAEDAKKKPSSALAQKRRNRLLMSQHRKALGNNRQLQSKISDIYCALDSGETQRILVWHVATNLCQIKLLLKMKARESAGVDLYSLCPMAGLPEHYSTAVNLSNYCAYLATKALVPDNGIVTNKVFNAVCEEAAYTLSKCSTLGEVHNALVAEMSAPDHQQNGPSIVKIGTELSMELMSTYAVDGEDLWERLGRFWAGYLLNLSANTTAAKHQVHLQGQGELTTFLWALLSHAGFLGDTTHGHQMLDTDDLNA